MALVARRHHERWVDPRSWRVKTLFTDGSASGSLLRIGPRRIEAVFAPSPGLPCVGRIGDLRVSNDDGPEEAVRRAVVADRVDVAADLLMFGFELMPGPDDRGHLPAGERRAVRIPISDERPLRAALRCSAGQTHGKVMDLSITGVSLLCPASAERQLAQMSRVEVRFADTTPLADRPIAGRIQHRRYDGDRSVVYGIEFAPGALAHCEAVIARLERRHVRLR